MAELALGTVQSLLGVIRKEAQRLAGVRGDMQFIRDEMESINGLLRHLSGTKERTSDHQVRAWMKQVMELAYDSGKCVERYTQLGRARPREKGFLGRLRRVSRLPWVIVVRRRVATRIRELKVRAREVGERQQRYGVAVPLKKGDAGSVASSKKSEWLAPHAHSRDASRRAVLSGPGSDMSKKGTEELIRWLEIRDFELQTPLRVVAIVGAEGATLAAKVYGHYKRQSSSSDALFDCKLSIVIRRPPSLFEILLDMLRQLQSEGYIEEATRNGEETLYDEQLKAKLQAYFRGKKLLLVLSSIDNPELWHQIRGALESFACSAGSAVLFSAKDSRSASECSTTKTQLFSHVDFYFKKAAALLVPSNFSDDSRLQGIKNVLKKCDMDEYCTKLFLQALYNNPNRTEEDLKSLSESLECSGIEKQNRMITFCYQGLPNQYKNCLWYSAVFTRGSYGVRRVSLMRRWVAEGLISKVGQLSALDEAKHCFNALLTQKLILSREVGGTGKIKTCGLNALVIGMIKETTTVDDFLDSSQLPPDLALHFSIRNGIHIRQLDNLMEPENMMIEPNSAMKSMIAHQRKSMLEFLRSLPTTSRLRLLRVLDLEGCKDFKKRHLKNICRIHQLRYLNLRGTNVARLPKQIDRLEYLETLDIRGTKVQVLGVVLPALKHLLAGNIYCPDEDTHVKSKESFSTVRMPHGAASMEKLEILSHVKVFDSGKELANIGDRLKQLRKLGVVLCGNKADMKDLFLQIDKLHRCLRSLSIRMEPPGNWDTIDAVLLTPPRLLESLRICGVRGCLPRRIRELHQLAKITLRDTLLNEDALGILGILRGLRCLRLRYHSFAEGALTFKNEQFSNLMNLVVEDDIITNIGFDAGTAPKLTKMVWSFIHMESLSGVKNLPSLTCLELNRGTYNFSGWVELQRGIKENHNHVSCVLNPPEDGEGSLHHEILVPGSYS